MESKTLINTMLFDFYGELLTEKQREYFDLYHNEDFSLSEISEKVKISRQGVHDIISRAEKTLFDFENKTGMVQKWLETRAHLKKAELLVRKINELAESDSSLYKLSIELINLFDELEQKR